MRNRFTLTLTDIYGSKHYNLHQIVKKFLIYFFIFVILVILGGVYFIHTLIGEVSDLENKKRVLNKNQFELRVKSEKLQDKIDEKINEFHMLEDKVSSIEKLVGITPDDSMDLDKRIENISISSSQKDLMLTLIPNGNVISKLRVTAPFGWRKHPIKKTREFHPGIDLKAKRGTPIKAPANGVVEFAAHHKRGYGKLIILDHSFGFQTRYAHLKKILVKNGQFIKKGDVIGHVGNTGLSTGPHLHYEVRFIGRLLNPINFLKWTKDNFDYIFKKETKVSWQSLAKIMTNEKIVAEVVRQKQQ